MNQLMQAAPISVDCRHLLDAMDGDQSLLRELVQMFAEEAPRALRELHEAIAAGDAARVRRAAHSMVGNSCNFGESPVPEIARRLEHMGQDGNLTGAIEVMEELETAVDGLCHGLAEMLETI